jgi:uncharacterized protein
VNLVEVRVHGLILEPKTQQNVVVLRELEGPRMLPIWIGPGEAVAIRRLLSEEPFPRPLTHDLLQLVVEGLHARVTGVAIVELRENTFYATIRIERDSERLQIDARPSDSIAVALRARVPIVVNEDLLQPAPDALPGGEGEEPGETPREKTDEERAEELRRFLEGLNPEDFGKFNL